MNKFDFPTYDIISFEREIPKGVTRPLLMRTTHDLYVVKTIDAKEEPKVLINEFVCYKLAKLLGLPIPNAALVRINEAIIASSPELKDLGVQPGIHFGSQFVNKSQSSIQPPMLKIMVNKEDIPAIIIFDHIVYNDDRTVNKGNLLFDFKEKKLLIIDHSHVFKIGALWDEFQLRRIMKEQLCLVKEFHGHNYRILLKCVNGHNPFNKILEKIKGLQVEDIEWCLQGIPDEWGLTDGEKSALSDFILHRIQNINTFLMLIKDQCPSWKGGAISEC
ncbi:HipA family kinase [Bacillus albus]|uniref:HipA family kinase n=1 Tax=Bacillus albus TaxID=2026189 RepID=UPI003D22117D